MPSQPRSVGRVVAVALAIVATGSALATQVTTHAAPPPTTVAPAPTAAPPTTLAISDESIDAAIDGLNAFMNRNVRLDVITEPCPIFPRELLDAFLRQQGLVANFSGYVIDIGLVEDYGQNPSTYCGGSIGDELAQPDPAAPISVGLEAAYLLGVANLESVLAAEEGALIVAGVPGSGGDIGGWCSTRAVSICVMNWERNDLMVSMFIGGPAGAFTQDQAVAMLAALIPSAVVNLGAALDPPGPATTTPLPPLPGSTMPPTGTAAPAADGEAAPPESTTTTTSLPKQR